MKLRDMMFISLFAAIMGVFAFFPPIPVPFIPVPITLQTLGVMLAGGVLGARRGGLSLLLFVFLVAVGVPLLTGGRGGLGVLIGPSGGYILSWPVAAWIIGYLAEKNIHYLTYSKLVLITILGGVIVVNIIGVTYLSILSNLPWAPTAISALVFLPGDVLKALIASAIIIKLNRVYPLIDNSKQPT
ncbi:biotin transporter BioY [Oceanobacillus sp. J11TS1]|uniref:biotin transporter BioY n=1 Tax=Oceanobacillus sp. J11TS1 TaxID=2807191 RepID=UPI001B2698D4|nr:biotin transporter BioY [Oceanobacillus sp. J11TS1]GIO22761.1 biotin transporter BioY [Oceanobacillus sp. J11TS1]